MYYVFYKTFVQYKFKSSYLFLHTVEFNYILCFNFNNCQ